SAMHVARLARVGLHESEARGELLANAIFHRVRQIVTNTSDTSDPYQAIRTDPGLLALLQSSIYGESVTDAAILDADGVMVALGIAVLVAALLAQLMLRPIHVIRSGLTRLGKGEFGVTLDLPPGDEFGELGSFFNTVSQQLSADRSQLAGQKANLQTAVEHL